MKAAKTIKIFSVYRGYEVRICNQSFVAKELEFDQYRVEVDATAIDTYDIRDQPDCGGSCSVEMTTRQFMNLERRGVIFESWIDITTAKDTSTRFLVKFRFDRAEWN